MATMISETKWKAGKHGEEVSEVIEFGLVDSKGRRIGTRLFVQPRFRYSAGLEREATGTFCYLIQSTRNGVLFGGIPRHEGDFATLEEAKVAAEKAAERSRKSQARKYGATVEEAKAKKAEQNAKSAAKVAAWLADYDARMAQRQAAAVAPAPVEAPVAPVEAPAAPAAPAAVEVAPVAAPAPVSALDAAHAFVEAEACRVLNRPRHVAAPAEAAPDEVARFRGFRDPDGALRFRRVETAPGEAPPAEVVPVEERRGVHADDYWRARLLDAQEQERAQEEAKKQAQEPAFVTRCGACGRTFSEPASAGEDFAAPGYVCGTCGRQFVKGAEDEILLATFARLVDYATRHYVDHVAGWSRFLSWYTFETFAAEARRARLRTFEDLLAHFRVLLRERLDEQAQRARVRAITGGYYDPDANLAE